MVRILDLATKAEKGHFWNNIHGAQNAHLFLAELSANAEANAGVAGPALVHILLKKDRTDAIVRLFQREQDSLLQDLGLQGQQIEGTVARGLKYFAAAMTVGWIAVTWRILPQTEAEIRDAIVEVARNWYDATMHPDAAALIDAVDILRTWISLKGDRKLKDISDGPSRDGTQVHVGWRDEVYLYLPGSTLESIVPKVVLSSFVAHLRDEGILDPGKEKDSLQYKMGSKNGRPRVYRIKRTALEQDV